MGNGHGGVRKAADDPGPVPFTVIDAFEEAILSGNF